MGRQKIVHVQMLVRGAGIPYLSAIRIGIAIGIGIGFDVGATWSLYIWTQDQARRPDLALILLDSRSGPKGRQWLGPAVRPG
jgi:hypothetical protein